MKRSFYPILLLLFFPVLIIAQTISGKLIDQSGTGLSGLQLQLYISPKIYNTVSTTGGFFTFNDVTSVKEDNLPSGFTVTDNYPNPFNPKTRINISCPHNSLVRVVVYNLLGQRIASELEKMFNAGTNSIDLDLDGLPNGIYFARITIDGKYSVTKKMMLMYGSQHLTSSIDKSSIHLNKTILGLNEILDTKIDSLVVTGAAIVKKVFTNLPIMRDNSLTLGNLIVVPLTICPASISYSGKVYNIIQVGGQCWFKENLDYGTMIPGSQNQANNGIIEKYCYNNDPNNCSLYGGLYQWGELVQYNSTPTGDKGICPLGWHVPTFDEMKEFEKAVNNNSNSIKAVGQGTGNGAGTNASGFSLLLAGNRSSTSAFFSLNTLAFLWTSSDYFGASSAYCVVVSNYDGTMNNYYYPVSYGLSVRCIKSTQETIPQIPILNSPENNAIGISTSPTLSWNESATATSYTLEVSAKSDFSNLIYSKGDLPNSSQRITGLSIATTYYWRVKGLNNYGESAWSSTWSFTTVEGATGLPCPSLATVVYSGKVYNTVLVGTQCWLRENLDVGLKIDGNSDQKDNGVIEKYCFNNDDNNCSSFGGLYQWNEAMRYSINPGTQGICPAGWHIPTLSEFSLLKSSVDYDGNSLKLLNQGTGDGSGTNTSGFSALLSGYRNYTGIFGNLNNGSYFWSSNEGSITEADGLALYKDNADIFLYYSSKNYGVGIRCLKNK